MKTLAVRYAPRGAAKQLFSSFDDEILISGPAGTGKSLACLYRLHLACMKVPGMKALVVRQTGVSLTSTTLVTYKEKVAKAAIKSGIVNWFGGNQEEAAAYHYENGSSIVVGGLDKPEKVLSSEYDLIFVDEATEISVKAWETLLSRLRNGVLPWQQIIAACNPSHPQHWIKIRADKGVMKHLVSRHKDNPVYYTRDGHLTKSGRAYIVGKLGKLTGVLRLRLLDGKWAAAEGVIFEQWDDAIHLVDAFDVPADWPRYWSVDFGFKNPFVCQMWAENPDGELFLYREFYHTKRTVDKHCETILETCTEKDSNFKPNVGEGFERLRAHEGRIWIEPKPEAIYCDHDAGGRAILEREIGFPTKAAHKVVSEGLQAVQRRLASNRLHIMRGCRVELDTELEDDKYPTCTYQEIPAYVWAERRAIIDVGGTVPKDEPVKEHDHGCDAMRYLVAARDLFGRTNIRFV